jgi:hypothetical protein
MVYNRALCSPHLRGSLLLLMRGLVLCFDIARLV